MIKVGQVIKIPCSNQNINNITSNSNNINQTSYISYQVVSGDTLSQIVNKFGTNYQ
jgi:LysM repeat protein